MKLKVLIVEDDPTILDTVALCFEMKWDGAECIYAADGQEGIKQAKSGSPDVIILDIGLPDMSGYNVLREIRTFSNVPVVILTVRDEEKDWLTGMKLGANDFVPKPFNPSEFIARVKAVLDDKHNKKSQIYKEQYIQQWGTLKRENIFVRFADYLKSLYQQIFSKIKQIIHK